MEGGPFDDNLFSDFSGCGSGTSALLSAKAHADSRGNVHSIQVMLGLQHSDMVLGKMDDMSQLFAQPADQHLAPNAKRKPEDGSNLQHQGEWDAMSHYCPHSRLFSYIVSMS
jgi:hypothetical protein